MTKYGQLVIGAPGAGKTTFCAGMLQILEGLRRPSICVNLDPANDNAPFRADIDIRELITVEDVMEKLSLGPNGALRYCMMTVADNLAWLEKRLSAFEDHYILVDMPGQLELYSFDDSVTKIVRHLFTAGWRLCAVHLSDSFYASDPGKFVSVALSALAIMVNLEMPQVNVLSKVDLIPPDVPFELDFFEQLPNLKYLVDLLDDHPVLGKYKKLSAELAEVIHDYNLVAFVGLDVQNKELMLRVLKMIDVANGFEFANIDDKKLRNIAMR